ncbi:hypothetical protein C8R44DRAFT_891884 [Mycena epipterygia]|nr:hypothetical protein C8R44DRAFT_891884 [Mycena epipterygia]
MRRRTEAGLEGLVPRKISGTWYCAMAQNWDGEEEEEGDRGAVLLSYSIICLIEMRGGLRLCSLTGTPGQQCWEAPPDSLPTRDVRWPVRFETRMPHLETMPARAPFLLNLHLQNSSSKPIPPPPPPPKRGAAKPRAGGAARKKEKAEVAAVSTDDRDPTADVPVAPAKSKTKGKKKATPTPAVSNASVAPPATVLRAPSPVPPEARAERPEDAARPPSPAPKSASLPGSSPPPYLPLEQGPAVVERPRPRPRPRQGPDDEDDRDPFNLSGRRGPDFFAPPTPFRDRDSLEYDDDLDDDRTIVGLQGVLMEDYIKREHEGDDLIEDEPEEDERFNNYSSPPPPRRQLFPLALLAAVPLTHAPRVSLAPPLALAPSLALALAPPLALAPAPPPAVALPAPDQLIMSDELSHLAFLNGGVHPPPSRSPEPQSTRIESELSDSAESYGAGEAFKERVDDLREFEKEIARHGFDDADAAPPSKKTRKTRSRTRSASGAASTASSDNDAANEESERVTTQRSKGKGKAVAAGRKHVSKKAEKKKAPTAYGVETTDEDAAEGGDDEADDEGDDGDGSGHHKTGTVPQDILDRAVVALAVFEDTVAELAKACGKAPQTLHRLVGTATKKPRDMSGWNVWQRWHAVERPKHAETTAAEYNQLLRSSFKQECTQRGLSPTEVSDSDAVFRALPWLLTWHTDLMDKVTEEWRDKGKFKSAVQKEMKGMIQLSRTIHKSLGVHVWGYCIDTKGQASFTWGGTDDFKAVRSSNKQSLSQTIKDMEHMFGMIDIQRRGLEAAEDGDAVLPVVAEQREGEIARDAHRRILSALLSTQLQRRLVAGGSVPYDKIIKTKMQWGPKFLDLAWEHQFRIINYPSVLEDCKQIIGDRFDVKKVSAHDYKMFLPPMQQANKRKVGNAADAEEDNEEEDNSNVAMAIVSWEEDENELPLEEQRNIGLVVSLTGARLRSVKHSRLYNATVEKKDKARKKSTTQKAGRSAPPPSMPRNDGAALHTQDTRNPSRDSRRPASPRSSRYDGAGPSHHEERIYAAAPRVGSSRHRSPPPSPPPPPRAHRAESSAPRASRDSRRPASPPRSSRYDGAHHEERIYAAAPRVGSSRHRSPPPPPPPPPRANRAASPAPRARSSREEVAYAAAPRAGSSRHHSPPPPPPPPPRANRAASPAPRARSSREEVVYAAAPRAGSSHHRSPPPPPPPLPRANLANRAASPPPRWTYAGTTKRRAESAASPDAAKRQRLEVSAQPKLWRMRFRVRNSPHTTKIWYASGFERVDHPTRADENTLRWDATTEDWVLLAPGVTPILASEDDRGRYQREVQEYGLYGPARG